MKSIRALFSVWLSFFCEVAVGVGASVEKDHSRHRHRHCRVARIIISTYHLGETRDKSIDRLHDAKTTGWRGQNTFESKPLIIETIQKSSKYFRSVALSASKWPREHAHEPIHGSEVWLVYSRYNNDISVWFKEEKYCKLLQLVPTASTILSTV